MARKEGGRYPSAHYDHAKTYVNLSGGDFGSSEECVTTLKTEVRMEG